MISLTKVKLLFASLFLFVGCSAIKNSQYEQYLSSQSEIPECLSEIVYPSTTNVTGTASFYKRGVNLVMQSTTLKSMYQGNPLAAALPIRFAEVAVYDANNKLVQCGKTDRLGNFKAIDGLSDLKIPKIAGNYTVRVLARSRKADINMFVAVKEDIYTEQVHYVSGSSFSNAIDDISNLNIKAYARQTEDIDIKGGAFNILNSVQTAYQYISINTSSVDTSCLNAKLNIFWKPGFNPYQYLYPSSNPANLANGSYYTNKDQKLFITGGRLGNISIETANHFDDYVIIHELGHHVEAQCGQLISPGGQHALVARIDSRLAWTEGWANYFAGQVMYSSIGTSDPVNLPSLNPEIQSRFSAVSLPVSWTYFYSSKGFTDTVQGISNGSGFMFDMTKPGNDPDTWQTGSFLGFAFDQVDPSRYPGEGHFREGAVTRGLFKISNNCGGSCISTTPVTFRNIWQSMDRLTGAGQTFYMFKDSHRVLEILKNIILAGGVATPINASNYKSIVNSAASSWTIYKNFLEATLSEALHLYSDGGYTSGSGISAISQWTPYGSVLSSRVSSYGTCADGEYYFQPRVDDPVLTATNSDQRYSNHFYTLDMTLLSGISELYFDFDYKAGTTTEFDILLYPSDYFFTSDYSCTSIDSNGNCLTSWQPSRPVATDVLRSDRRVGLTSKVIKNLNLLDPTKKYLINIRAYTANKSLSTTTSYAYKISDQDNYTICR